MIVTPAEFRMEIADIPCPIPDLYIGVAQYAGPNRFNLRWKVVGPFIAPQPAEDGLAKLGRYYRRRRVYKLS